MRGSPDQLLVPSPRLSRLDRTASAARAGRPRAIVLSCLCGAAALLAGCRDPFITTPVAGQDAAAPAPSSGGSGGSSGSSNGGSTGSGGAGGSVDNGGSGGNGGEPSTPGDGGPKPSGSPDGGAGNRDAAAPDATPMHPPLIPKDAGSVLYTDAPPAAPPPLPGQPDPQGGNCPLAISDISNWFPVTPPVKYFTPLPHPETECPFYMFSFQNFLIATQQDASGKPAFLSWNSIENTFGAHAGEPPPAIPVLNGGVTQAGGRQVLVDQNGHAIYYAIHFNQRFQNFVWKHKLTDAQSVKNADPTIKFDEPDIVETKSAWMIVPDNAPPQNFITAKVRVPTITFVNNKPVEDYSKLRDVTAALIAIHIVFTIPGHPEFIWSSFDHIVTVGPNRGLSDIAPAARTLPGAGTLPTTVISPRNHILYRGGTTVANANRVVAAPVFDVATQTFGPDQATSIYRQYPGSLSHQPDPDEDVVDLNDNMLVRYGQAPLPAASDKRVNYLMVAAVWLDRPDRTFGVDKTFFNNPNDPDIIKNGPESANSITGGEDRLSSTAMESFTQDAQSFPNCFHCHDTQAATVSGVPSRRDTGAEQLLGPKGIGVSHVFNEVLRLKP